MEEVQSKPVRYHTVCQIKYLNYKILGREKRVLSIKFKICRGNDEIIMSWRVKIDFVELMRLSVFWPDRVISSDK